MNREGDIKKLFIFFFGSRRAGASEGYQQQQSNDCRKVLSSAIFFHDKMNSVIRRTSTPLLVGLARDRMVSWCAGMCGARLGKRGSSGLQLKKSKLHTS